MKSNIISFLVGIAAGVIGLVAIIFMNEEREKWG